MSSLNWTEKKKIVNHDEKTRSLGKSENLILEEDIERGIS